MDIQTDTPIVAIARTLLHRGDDGGVPINHNGVGLNRVDYPIVKSILAAIGRQGGDATTGQVRGLATILRKYARQLGELGYDVAMLTAPLTVAPLSAPIAAAVEHAFAQVEEREQPRTTGIPKMAQVLGSSGPIAQRLPGYEPRPAQIEIAQHIANAIEAEKSIIAEAGTGTGKSLAYLIPAILSGKKTIVSTEGKALQDQLAGKDLPFLQSVLQAEFEFAVLKGLSNYLCRMQFADEAPKQQRIGETHEFAVLREWVERTQTGDLAEVPGQLSPELRSAVTTSSDECLGKDCAFAGECFVMQARERAKRADVVVVNHTLLALDLALRDKTGDGVSILPDRDVVIIDEAHTVEDTATKAFTDEVREFAAANILSGRLPALAEFESADIKAARAASERLFAILHRDERSAFRVAPTAEFIDASMALAGHLKGFRSQANHAASASYDMTDTRKLERYADRLGNLADAVLAMTVEPEDGEIVYAEFEWSRNGRRVGTLKRAPVTVADDLKRALWNRWPTVATSATLQTANGFDYFRERTGAEHARAVAVDSPFDYRRNALIYLPQDGASFDPSKYRQDGSVEYFDRLAREIERLLLASDGRAFCLFTSRKALDEVYDRIADRLRYTVLKQGDYGTQEIVRRFREHGNAVLFGLRSFWTGVDVQGEALSLVIVDKLPFPTPDEPVYQARCDLLNQQAGDKWAWFNRLALPMATMQFKQGFGRLIRTKEDRGVVALLDGRLTTKGYGTGIIRSLPPATVTRSIDAVESFFAMQRAA